MSQGRRALPPTGMATCSMGTGKIKFKSDININVSVACSVFYSMVGVELFSVSSVVINNKLRHNVLIGTPNHTFLE